MTLRNFRDKIRRFCPPTKQELVGFVVSVLVVAFIVSFNWWGKDAFDPLAGVWNLMGGMVLVTIVLFVHHFTQRVVGVHMGFRVEQTVWWYGLIGGLILVFVSNGALQLLAVTGTYVMPVQRHRIGKFRHKPNLCEFAKVCLAGPLANILFGGIVMTLAWARIVPDVLAKQVFSFCLAFAAWNLLPIPPLDGSRIMFQSRLVYSFLFGTIASYAFMVYILDVYSYILAILIGIVTMIVVMNTIEVGLR